MPIYEYACQECGHTFEEWLAHSDTASCHPCPDCGQQARRILSNTTFILKDGGWYETDYGKKKEDAPVAKEAKTETANTDAAQAASPAPANTADTAAQAPKAAENSAPAPTVPKAPAPAPSPPARTAEAAPATQAQ